jgi:hypothetical protein
MEVRVSSDGAVALADAVKTEVTAGSAGFRRWLAWGTGVAVEIAANGVLRLMAVKVSPGGVDVLATGEVTGFGERPAVEWGAECVAWMRKAGVGHVALNVLLPRGEMILRPVAMPGVAGKDVPAALAFQVDALHPYGEGEAAWAWARVPDSPHVLVGIIRREALEHYLTLFREAGLKTASFTVSAAALYSAMRLLARPPRSFFTLVPGPTGVEVYGESEAHPVYSAAFELPEYRAATLAKSELRLEPESEAAPLTGLLPTPRRAPATEAGGTGSGAAWAIDEHQALLYATALAGACPMLALEVNLLPAELRSSSSRLMYVPTIVLGVILAAVAFGVPLQSRYEDRKYRDLLDHEIGRYRPLAEQVSKLETRIEATRARTRLLDSMKARTKADLDVINEITRLLAPPTWVTGLELGRETVFLTGESDQAVGLLKTLDGSPLFRNSEFVQSLQRVGSAEAFRIRITRKGGPTQ